MSWHTHSLFRKYFESFWTLQINRCIHTVHVHTPSLFKHTHHTHIHYNTDIFNNSINNYHQYVSNKTSFFKSCIYNYLYWLLKELKSFSIYHFETLLYIQNFTSSLTAGTTTTTTTTTQTQISSPSTVTSTAAMTSSTTTPSTTSNLFQCF